MNVSRYSYDSCFIILEQRPWSEWKRNDESCRQHIRHDVNTSSLSPMNLLVVTLWYLKHYYSERYIATELNLPQRTVGYSLSSVLGILHSCVYSGLISLPADMSNITTQHGTEEYHKLIVDSTFIAIPQPDDSTERKAYYHVKSARNYALKVKTACALSP